MLLGCIFTHILCDCMNNMCTLVQGDVFICMKVSFAKVYEKGYFILFYALFVSSRHFKIFFRFCHNEIKIELCVTIFIIYMYLNLTFNCTKYSIIELI